MNRVLKVVALVAGIVLLVGVVLAGIGVLCGGKLVFGTDFANKEVYTQATLKSDSKNTKMIKDSVKVDDFTKLSVNTESIDVVVCCGEENVVSYNVPENAKPEIKVENGTLKVSQNTKMKNGIHISFGYTTEEKCIITVFVKNKTILQDINIAAESGNVTMKDIHGSTCMVKTESGDLEIENCDTKATKLYVESGNVTVKDSTMTNATGESESGDVAFEQSTMKQLDVSAESGNVELSDTDSEQLKAKAESGDISIDTITVKRADLNCASGNIEMTVKGKRQNYNIDCVTDSGSITIDDQDEGDAFHDKNETANTIKAETDCGDVSIGFAS